ncbi:MAG: N-formylglutamate amidohydrolase [Cyanobacteria bacterium P01_A01_bin.37]
MTEPFRLHLPKSERCPIVANLPHSGLLVPEAIAQTLNEPYQRYLPNQDWHLDKLYDFLPSLGITVLEALYSRYVVDLNRSAQEPFFGNFWQSAIPEKTAFNAPLYQISPSQDQLKHRLEQFYHPYHKQLEQVLKQLLDHFDQVFLLDLHSFFGLIEDEICLGNVNGQSCSEFLMSAVESEFASSGYQVVRNKVFSGGYITRHYGQMPRVEALQIEIRYPTYLASTQLDQSDVPDWNVPEFYHAQSNFEAIFRAIADRVNAIAHRRKLS